jgi:hypothetical protein
LVVFKLRELTIVATDGIEVRIDQHRGHVIGEFGKPLDGIPGSDRSGDRNGFGRLSTRGHDGNDGGGASSQTIIHNQHGFAGDGQTTQMMEFRAIAGQTLLFPGNHARKLGPINVALCDGGVVEHEDIRFSEGANSKFRMTGMTNLTHGKNVERTLQNSRDLGCNHDATAGQAQNGVRLDSERDQMNAQFPSGFGSR